MDESSMDGLSEQKREALDHLTDAWHDALAAGVEPDIIAHAALFAALADLVTAYGEVEVAQFAAGLAERIGSGEFTVPDSTH